MSIGAAVFARPWRRLAITMPVAVLLGAMPARADDVAPQTSVQAYSIPAQPLDTGLARFSDVSGVDVLLDKADAVGRRSAPVIGIFGPPQALRQLLSGTGLVARFTSRTSAVITRAEVDAVPHRPGTAESDVIVLDRMQVTAPRLIGTPRAFVSGRFIADMADQIRRIMVTAKIVDRGAAARLRIQTRIRADGTLYAVRVAIASADPVRDTRIVALLEGAHLDLAPPEGMPQPLKFDVAGQ